MEVLECLLCFWAWTKQYQFWLLKDDKTATATVQHAMRLMLLKIRTQLPRYEGMGWKISKFHELLHLVKDMRRYGSPVNTSASSPEHNHLYFAKRPGRRAQKDHATFDHQVATRLTNSMMLQSIAQLMSTSTADHDDSVVVATNEALSVDMSSISETIGNATAYSLQINANSLTCFVTWHAKTSPGVVNLHDPSLIKFITKKFCGALKWSVDNIGYVNMVTEYKRDMYCFRVHPNYHNTGRWQDWVPIQFKGYEEPHPCRIEAIIPGMLNRNHLVLDDYKMVYLVVTCCTEIKQTCLSVLFDIWKYDESAYHLVEATTIVAPCYVCLLYTSPSPRDLSTSRMPSSA